MNQIIKLVGDIHMDILDLTTPRLIEFFKWSVDNHPNNIAIICDCQSLSYQELEGRTNQLANYLIHQGIKETDHVGIFLERSIESYIAILAVMKTGATYVPIETEYPDERVNYILADLPFAAIITTSSQFARNKTIRFPHTIVLDDLESFISQQTKERPLLTMTNALCYVIYTSGSTGKPKGVEITHSSICHYVTTASKLYQMTPEDRIYQGFSLAFDASLEELWMAFANGATLVACTSKDTRSGVNLIDFLNSHQVTVFSTVPTLLSTLEPRLSHLRLLILGGEACTTHLVNCWSRESLRIVNTYGPTEATVIATYAECESDKPITIGKPLPGYDVLILDEHLQPVSEGEQGQLCIGGLGLARGYVNRPEITMEKFIPHPNDAEQRLYLTGDLAKINTDGDIEFLGRIDSQIKLRGFRIELNEIETVIMAYEGINQVVVSLEELNKPTLVAYLLLGHNKDFSLQQLKQFLQQQLPLYMIPSIFEEVLFFPLLPSGKVDRKALPKPSHFSVEEDYIPPTTDMEISITKIWEESLQQHPISIDDDFFYDLGGHSLSAASIVSNLRKITNIEEISILDLYQNPTVRQLAEKFSHFRHHEEFNEKSPKKNRVANLTYYLCGVGQFFGCLLQYAIRSWQLLAVVLCYAWLTENASIASTIFTLVVLFLGLPLSSLAITIAAKWLLLGRVKPGTYKLWGWFYLRWWLVERLQTNIFSPHHWIGSPIIILYYRLLGAKIGKNCYMGTSKIVAHDLINIGDNCSIGLDARLFGYVVEDGWLKIGNITINDDCFVGARSVVSIDTTMNKGSCLDDMSMLPIHRHIPAYQFFSGSPARPSDAPPEHVFHHIPSTQPTSPLKNVGFGLLHYISLISVRTLYYACYLPALLLITHFHEQTHILLTLTIATPLGAIIFLCLYYLSISTCKKILMNKIKPGTYSLKSLYYLRQWTVAKMLEVDEIHILADTLYFPYILRFLGAKLGKRVEMGETPHIIPDLITIRDEGFTASAVALAWPSVYQGSIKFAPIEIGKRGFVGNDSLLPLGSHIGEGGLLGCMTITPPNNQAAHHNTAWLGSPAVFLPKRELSTEFSDTEKFTPPKRLFNTRLAIEFVRIILPTTFNLIEIFGLLATLTFLFTSYSLTTVFLVLPIADVMITLGLVSTVILLKWVVLGKLKSATKPIWNIFIWKNDVIGNLYHYYLGHSFTHIVQGTPFISALFRLFGAKVGKRAFINSDDMTEFDLITIGDEACINAEAVLQTHLYEDRIFKMSVINIENGCNIGVASIILYHTIMEKNATLGNFSLLMKGETLPKNTSWQGVPAQPMRAHDIVDEPQNNPINTSSDPLILEPAN